MLVGCRSVTTDESPEGAGDVTVTVVGALLPDEQPASKAVVAKRIDQDRCMGKPPGFHCRSEYEEVLSCLDCESWGKVPWDGEVFKGC